MAYSIVLDTETAPLLGRQTPQPEPWNSLVYDLGGVVVDNKTGNVMESFSFAISETFADSRTMKSAYYAAKLPQYFEGMGYTDAAKWRVVTFHEAMAHVRGLCKRYNIRKAWAYNCKFDEAALNATTRHYSNGFVGFFLPYGVEWCDIWDYSDCLRGTRFLRFCEAHEFFTEKGNPQTNAEVMYAYLTDNADHVERHTALSDATEEAAILTAARRKHSRKSTSKGQGWRKTAKLYRELKEED